MRFNEQPYFEHDISYMQQAYDLAIKAFNEGEIPVGALIVSPEGHVLGSGYNRVENQKSQSAHAEMFAIQSASKVLNDWRLEGCVLYVTLQPCMMCYGLLSLSRVERIVYGAHSPLYGFHIDMQDLPAVYTKHLKFFSSGVMKEEIEALLRKFFKKRRSELE